MPTVTRVLILQHPRERDVGVNTARMAALALPNCEIRLGVCFENDSVVRAALSAEDRTPIVLYPGRDAVDVRSIAAPAASTLILLDGTWSQARKIFNSNPALRHALRVGFVPSTPSRYRIRREPAAHCVSTIEALCETLSVLEGDAASMQRLLRPFESMVEAQLEYVRQSTGRCGRNADARLRRAERRRRSAQSRPMIVTDEPNP